MITTDALKKFAPSPGNGDTKPSSGISASPEALREYLEALGIKVKEIKGSGVLILAGCPMNPDHGDHGDTAIVWRPDGIGFACKHNSCIKITWPEVRRKIDPSYSEPVKVTATTAAVWEPPIPLTDHELPEFPREAFPAVLSVLSEYCEAVATSYQVPVDLPAMLALAGAGAALAKRIEVHVRGDHREPVNLFTAIAMEPANRKSSVFAEISRPISEYERELAESMAPAIERNRSERAILEAQLKHAQNEAAKARDYNDRIEAKRHANEIAEQLRQTPVLISPRLLADDATPERLAGLLHDHGGRIALLSPEGDTFDLMAGRYGTGGPNLGVYLKGHAGDDLRVDRIGRAAEFIERPALTIGLAVQPAVLRGLTDRPGFRGKGLLARFLYSIPRSTLGRRELTPPPVPKSISSGYHALIHAALRLTANEDNTPRIVRVGEQALEQLLEFAKRVEPELAANGGFASMQDWAGKLVGACARIAGIYHGLIYAHTGRPEAYPIDAETILCSIVLAEYLVPHARAAFSEMGADASIELARRLLEWLRFEPRKQFTRREAHRAISARVNKVGDVDEPLRVLEDHGYIRAVESEAKKTGRRPSPVYEVNPGID